MNEKNKAIGKTFLWQMVYGFVISIILAIISFIGMSMIAGKSTSSATDGEIDKKGIDDLFVHRSNTIFVLTVAYFAGFIAHVILTFGTCYDYGRDPCIKNCQTWNETSTDGFEKPTPPATAAPATATTATAAPATATTATAAPATATTATAAPATAAPATATTANKYY
jgi:hypothetical protein